MIRETISLSPTGHTLHKATLPRLAGRAGLHNTEKQIQRDSQNEETKKHAPNKIIEKSSERELNKVESSTLPDTELKIIIIKVFKELRGRMDEHSGNINKEIVSIKK